MAKPASRPLVYVADEPDGDPTQALTPERIKAASRRHPGLFDKFRFAYGADPKRADPKHLAEASAKVDAAVADLQKFRVKAAVKVPEGFTKGAIDAFESHRKGQLKVCDDQDRRLAAARQRLKEVAALLK